MPKRPGCCENTHTVGDDGTALLTELVELLPGRDAFAAKPGTQSRELKLGTICQSEGKLLHRPIFAKFCDWAIQRRYYDEPVGGDETANLRR